MSTRAGAAADPRRAGGLGTAILGALLFAAGAAVVGVQITTWSLDETLFKQSAVHYTTGLPDSLLHDLNARATTRLYPLLLTPVFAAFDGDVAVRLAKVVNALLFASAAVPAYLLARAVIVSRRLAVAAALLAVAAPWLTISTALFAENLAYPVFLWLVHAIFRSVREPSPGRDLAVLAWLAVALGARVQLAAAVGGYVVIVLAAAMSRARAAPAGERASAAWARLRASPFTVAAVALGGAVLIWLAVGDTLARDLDDLLGGYAEFQRRNTLPNDVPLGAEVELMGLALGIGVVPAILALAWFPAALGAAPGDPARQFAVVSLVCVASLWAFTLAAQNGFNAQIGEERYFFYAVPFAWIAAFSALERPRARSASIAWAGVALALLFGAVTLPFRFDAELFLRPAGASVSRLCELALDEIRGQVGLLGLTPRDLLFTVVLAIGLAVWRAWRSAPWARRWLLGGAALAQLALTVYAFLAIDGRVASGLARRSGGVEFAQKGWIDRTVGERRVTWVLSAPHQNPAATIGALRDALFWNDRFVDRLRLPELGAAEDPFPADALPTATARIDLDGELRGAAPDDLALEWIDSPLVQLAGRELARSSASGPFVLIEPARPLRAVWVARGLGPDGSVRRGPGVSFVARPARSGETAVLEFGPPPKGEGRVVVRIGSDRIVRIDLSAGARPVSVRVNLCRVVSGAIAAQLTTVQDDGAAVAAQLLAVRRERPRRPC